MPFKSPFTATLLRIRHIGTPGRFTAVAAPVLLVGLIITLPGQPWSAAASDAPLGNPAVAVPVVDGGTGGASLSTADRTGNDADAPGARRTPKQIAQALYRKLNNLKDAKHRGDRQSEKALKDDLSNDRQTLGSELQDQLSRGTTPVYWAVSMLQDAIERDDDEALDRALRYLRQIASQ